MNVKAKRELRRAQKGNVDSMYQIGMHYLHGQSELPVDKVEGEKWLKMAAEAKYIQAMYALSMLYLDEDLTKEGILWLRKASQAGDKESKAILEQYEVFEQAKNGNKEALEKLMEGCLDFGYKGERWLREMAKSGNVSAMVNLGERYLRDPDSGTQSQQLEIREGEEWLKKAIERGNIEAMFELGWKYIIGDNLPRNQIEGLRLLTEAAERGNLKAMQDLGEYYLDGFIWPGDDHRFNVEEDLFPINRGEGEKWLKKLAETGDVNSMFDLGRRYLDGNGLPINKEEGEYWILKAAQPGHTYVMSDLADRYLNGKGLKKDVVNAEKYLRMAAMEDDGFSMLRLGEYYLQRDKLPENREEGEK